MMGISFGLRFGGFVGECPRPPVSQALFFQQVRGRWQSLYDLGRGEQEVGEIVGELSSNMLAGGVISIASAKRSPCIVSSSLGVCLRKKSEVKCGALLPLVTLPPLPSVTLATPSVTSVPPTVHTAPTLTALLSRNGSAGVRGAPTARPTGGGLRMVTKRSSSYGPRRRSGPKGSSREGRVRGGVSNCRPSFVGVQARPGIKRSRCFHSALFWCLAVADCRLGGVVGCCPVEKMTSSSSSSVDALALLCSWESGISISMSIAML